MIDPAILKLPVSLGLQPANNAVPIKKRIDVIASFAFGLQREHLVDIFKSGNPPELLAVPAILAPTFGLSFPSPVQAHGSYGQNSVSDNWCLPSIAD